MTAAKLLADLTGQGFVLAAEGSGIRVQPASRLSADLRQAIVANRAELLALLGRAETPTPACPTCRRPLDSKARCWKCCNRVCAAGCGRQTGSAFLALCLQCEATMKGGA